MATWDKDVPPFFWRQGEREKAMRYLAMRYLNKAIKGDMDVPRSPRIGGEDGTG